ncbi:OmpA family protein [Kineosporia mesophila]|uniref:OmpA family protein n=1 Tax=Kineosporia mesophila TaxID=566012 RepID=UPI001E4CA118|nr:OmpA family protein [Kineosporia mesophila]
MNDAPPRDHESPGPGFALYGPDPLEPVRDAILQRDPGNFVLCFTPDGRLRVPRREGDIVVRGRDDLGRAARDVQLMIRELSWTPSRRFVSSGEVTEEAVAVVHQQVRRPGRASAHPLMEDELRVPLRVVATLEPDGLISSLTLWLDWAALSDPQGTTSAEGAASALVTLARSRDDRGLRVLQTPSAPLIEPFRPEPESRAPDRPKPMGRGALWWKLHRNALAGGLMALAAVLLVGWVGLIVLVPARDASPMTGHSALRAAESTPDPDRPDTRNRPAPVVSSPVSDVPPTVQEGQEITFLSDVLFPSGSFRLSPRAHGRLEQLATQIRETGVRGRIQVNGYTDSIGSDQLNLDLSRRRASAVATALSRKLRGVDVKLLVQGFGETSARADNSTEAGRRMNRRVIVVLPLDPP